MAARGRALCRRGAASPPTTPDVPGGDLDLTWLRDASLEDRDALPAPEVVAREIVEDLTAALTGLEAVATALEASAAERGDAGAALAD